MGESVQVPPLGTFLTERFAARRIEDPPGSGTIKITLPHIEPAFMPDEEGSVAALARAQQEFPEKFITVHDDEQEDEEESEPQAVAAEAPQTSAPAAEPRVERPLGKASLIRFVDLSNQKIDQDILHLIPLDMARKYKAVAIELEEGRLTVAMLDPEDFEAVQAIQKQTDLTIQPALTTKDDLSLAYDQYTGLQSEVQQVLGAAEADLGLSAKDLKAAANELVEQQDNNNAPTARIVASLLSRAVKEHASDIHIEPGEHRVQVRFRIDGVLLNRLELPKTVQGAITSRIKIMANLKIDEQRLPQDGRMNMVMDRREVDFRVSTIPVVFGEKVVMRILDKSTGIRTLEQVGLTGKGFDTLEKNLQKSHGMILVTGPTGSGKTTTLYAVLGRMMAETVNILTLEDPVEYRIEAINQSQVHSDIGYTFAAGLRAAVRQDPDIIMLGEIRDQETADMAVHAALTGHIVLSTLHTNDAAGSFPRLIDMHIEPFLITSSIHTVIGQRLTRAICPDCRQAIEMPKEQVDEVEAVIATMAPEHQKGLEGKRTFYKGAGCDRCNNSGYKGRSGVFEVLSVSEEIRNLILKRSSGDDITRQAVSDGMLTMVQDGIIKVLDGITTLEEVWRVTRE